LVCLEWCVLLVVLVFASQLVFYLHLDLVLDRIFTIAKHNSQSATKQQTLFHPTATFGW
jgi:hypothetical protein